jgi:hypothetical protein
MLGMALCGNAASAEVPMSTPHPHSAADLALAPVLISIERNLARLRDCTELEYELALELNDDSAWYHTPAERAHRVQQLAIRDVDLHGWDVSPTPDQHGLAVTHGGYSIPVMLGKRLADYVAHGTYSARPQQQSVG